MGKKKKLERQAQALAKAAEEEAQQAALAQRSKRSRAYLIGIPIATAILAVITYLATDDRRAVALSVVVGLAFWIPVVLGAIGGSVPPRDGTRAGSIDFGRRD